MYLGLQVAAAVFAVLAIVLSTFRWSVARAGLDASNRVFGSRFDLEGRDLRAGRGVVLFVAALLAVLAIVILYNPS